MKKDMYNRNLVYDLITSVQDTQSKPLTEGMLMEALASIPESNPTEMYVPGWFVETAAENGMSAQEYMDYLVAFAAAENYKAGERHDRTKEESDGR